MPSLHLTWTADIVPGEVDYTPIPGDTPDFVWPFGGVDAVTVLDYTDGLVVLRFPCGYEDVYRFVP